MRLPPKRGPRKPKVFGEEEKRWSVRNPDFSQGDVQRNPLRRLGGSVRTTEGLDSHGSGQLPDV